MAKLIPKQISRSICSIECYSERGVMVYFVYRHLTILKHFKRFLKNRRRQARKNVPKCHEMCTSRADWQITFDTIKDYLGK